LGRTNKSSPDEKPQLSSGLFLFFQKKVDKSCYWEYIFSETSQA
jgi:hypothetical protein